MELFLNLTWAVIVLAAAVRFARWSSGQTSRRRRIVALATICVLALLFPIISVTDDLHSDAAVLEETNAVRRTATVLTAHLHAPTTGFVADLLTGALYSIERRQLSIVGTVATDRPMHLREGVRVTAEIRPPPTPLA